MLFSTTIFLFVFLPLVLAVYYNPIIRSRQFRNVFLLLASIFFYAWGEPFYVLLMLLSIVVNWGLGLLVDRFRNRPGEKAVLLVTVVYNLGVLFLFKYLNFTVNNLNLLFRSDIRVPQIALPVGISFYTFQAMSYVLDVHRGKGEAQKNPLNVGLYIALFPQLIAGPIVRYETVAWQIGHRQETLHGFYEGILRFIYGLGKKILLANTLALGADACFGAIAERNLSFGAAWLGAIFYSLQILFDFSGYSDMAIGLGKMFGFEFLENFNYPYISRTVTEFWRRWHISLSSWFRDYVYIPLGGSRVSSRARHIFNLFVVWLLTGIWHGANWTFILWGLMYFVVLTIEKMSGRDKKPLPLSRVYTLIIVIVGWTIFRSDNLPLALKYISNMFGIGCVGFADASCALYLKEYGVYLAAAILACIPWGQVLAKKVDRNRPWVQIGIHLAAFVVFALAVIYMVKGTYNPFIYFTF